MNKPTHILIPIEDINILKMLVAAIDLRSDNAPAIKKFINQFLPSNTKLMKMMYQLKELI